MKYKRKPNRKQQALVVVAAVVAVSAVIILFAHAGISNALAQEGTRLESQAGSITTTQGQEGLLDLQLALGLNPRNYALARKLAAIYIANNRPDNAIAALKHLPLANSGLQIAQLQLTSEQLPAALATLASIPGSNADDAALQLKSKALLEQGNVAQAISAAQSAYRQDPSSTPAQVQYGLCLGVSHNITSLRALAASVGATEAAQTLQQALAGNLSLGEALYAQGLLDSAQRALQAYPDASTEKYELQANIELAQPNLTTGELQTAASDLGQAIALNPGNLQLHIELKEIDGRLGNSAGVERETALISQLHSGKV